MVATVEFPATCNQSLAAIEPAPVKSDYRFLAYYLETRYLDLRALVGDDLRDGLNLEHVRSVPTPLPPVSEQLAIARYLDDVDRRIRRYIRAKQKLTVLLDEQKKTIIQRAVFGDLDVTGSQAGHTFSRTRLGRACASIRDGTHNPPPATPGEHRLLSVRNVVGGRFVTRDDDRTMSRDAFADLQRSYSVEPGDVVIALVGATTGKSAVVGRMQNVTVQRSLGILRPNRDRIYPEFLNLMLRSEFVQAQIRGEMTKYAAQPGIYLDTVGRLTIALPSLTEQRNILAEVTRYLSPIDELQSHGAQAIGLLREYRTNLIADAVTGKIDVREAAARLPDEADERLADREVVTDEDDGDADDIDAREEPEP